MKLFRHGYPSPLLGQDASSSSETALPKAANVDLATMPDLLMPGPDMDRGLPGACNHRHDPDWFVIVFLFMTKYVANPVKAYLACRPSAHVEGWAS